MKLRVVFFLFAVLVAVSTFGQSVSLTGTVTDTPDSQTWNTGTISFTFFGPQGTSYRWTGGTLNPNIPITATLSSSGTYSVSVPDNSQITPTDSSWNVKVCTATLPQSCFVSPKVVITSASTTLNLTPPSPRFSVPLTPAAISPISAYGDAEISGGWVGFNYSQLGTTVSTRICQAVSATTCTTWASSGASSSPTSATIYSWDPKYNLPAPGKWVCDATFNGTTTVTTPATDRPFLSTDSFAIVVGGNAQCGGNAQSTITTLTGGTNGVDTATFVSAHQITLAHATGSCTPTTNQGGCALFWGADASSAIQSAFNDASNNCGTLVLPAGGVIINTVVSNTSSLCPVTDVADDAIRTITTQGQGQMSTMLLFTPNASFSTPMFAVNNTIRNYLHDFAVASFTSATATQAGQTAFSIGFNSEIHHVTFENFFPSSVRDFTALACNGVGNALTSCHNLLMLNAGGSTGSGSSITTNGTDVNIYDNWVQGANRCLSITGGSTGFQLDTWGNRFTLCGIQGAVQLSGGANTWNSYGDRFNGGSTSLQAVGISGTAGTVVNFHNVNITGTGTTGPALTIAASNTASFDGSSNIVQETTGTGNGISNSGTLTLRNTTVTSAGGTGLANAATGIVTVKEGNTLSNGLTNTSGGVFQGQDASGVYSGACTGVVTSATTVGLYGLGQTAATTCTSTTVGSGRVMSHSGSVYALFCTATAGNQATDACTVVKNGAAQTMTCSLNGVANCFDGATGHVVTFVAGDILGIEAVGGTSTTLANVKGTFVTN